MALDKQRILNELGSVMNQLQSADCGCMGKLFSDPGNGGCAPTGNPLPTCGGCRRGLCPGHGHGVHYNNGGGDPNAINAGGMHRAGGMQGGGMQGGGMHGGGMQGGGMHGGGMHGGGMHGGCMQGGCMHGGCMHGSGMHGGGVHRPGGMQGKGMFDGGMQSGGMNAGDMISGGMPGGGSGMSGCGMPGGDMPSGNMFGGMGRRAPELYANTYSYLNQNFMQPLVKEVYQDLSTITPQNTIGNNPLAAKMGLRVADGGNPTLQGSPTAMGSPIIAGDVGNPNMDTSKVSNVSAGGMSGGPGGGAPMGGMGSQIMNMMMSGGRGKPANPAITGQGNPQAESILIDAPHSPHGQIGVTPLAPGGGNMGMQQVQANAAMSQGNSGSMMQQPTTQYVAEDNIYTANPLPPQGKAMAHMPSGAPATRAMPAGGSMNPYGVHGAGVNKFKEMFPDVMKEGLDFDPMAIAIQMNPANQKKAALATMNKFMDGNKGMSMMQPGTNATLNQPGAVLPSQEMAPGTQPYVPVGQAQNQQQIANPGTIVPPQQQQVYTAVTGDSVMNQGLPQQVSQQQMQGQQQFQQDQLQQGQQLIDPNTGTPITPGQERTPTDARMMQQNALDPGQNMVEPIYPAVTTPQYTYNTLGQPIQLLQPNAYKKLEQAGIQPQTLFGGPGRGYDVKNTMSKTSLAGNRALGAKASRSQLQHIYRQYKAQSLQNIRTHAPVQGGSMSQGQLNTSASANASNPNSYPTRQQIPVEKVGGDTFESNPNVQLANMDETKFEQGGDIQTPNSPKGDQHVEKSPVAEFRKGRNGLQDMTFTRYRATSGWSFHG